MAGPLKKRSRWQPNQVPAPRNSTTGRTTRSRLMRSRRFRSKGKDWSGRLEVDRPRHTEAGCQ